MSKQDTFLQNINTAKNHINNLIESNEVFSAIDLAIATANKLKKENNNTISMVLRALLPEIGFGLLKRNTTANEIDNLLFDNNKLKLNQEDICIIRNNIWCFYEMYIAKEKHGIRSMLTFISLKPSKLTTNDFSNEAIIFANRLPYEYRKTRPYLSQKQPDKEITGSTFFTLRR